MSPLPRRFISLNTGSNALSCGLVVAIAAVAVVIGLARYDLMRPIGQPMFLKLHSQSDRAS
jgi:hypothetical protein